MNAPRSLTQRITDTREKLQLTGADVWVASNGSDGAYLVPLSYAWHDECVVIACEASSRTARNLVSSGNGRLGFGPTRDVVMIDVVVDGCEPVADMSAEVMDAYANQAGWDARVVPENVVLHLRPTRVQAWREANEIAGRTLMRGGAWLE